MQKRTAIGLAVLAMIGVCAYVLSHLQTSRSEPGSVEWHKREYLAAYRDYKSNIAFRVAGLG